MKKELKKAKIKQELKTDSGLRTRDFMLILMVLAFLIIPTYTPEMGALDSNGPKFLMLGIVNVLMWVYLIISRDFQTGRALSGIIFKAGPLAAFAGLLVFSLVSFTGAISIPESVLHYSKQFVVFASALTLSVVLLHKPSLIRFIAIGMSLMLMVESIAVFINIIKFIQGEVAAIADIKVVYSNKNILASAIFVKLVFSYWLFVSEKGYWKHIGWTSLFMGVLATFFMATRAFYLGTIAFTLVATGYYAVVYFKGRSRTVLMQGVRFFVAVLLGFTIFSFVQQNLYPKNDTSRHTQAVAEQLGTLKDIESAGGGRFDGWKWSWEMIKEKPFTGVGAGNWKINSLRYEHQTDPGFTHLYKAHNDFFETAAETGIPGFISYIALLGFTFFMFLRVGKKGREKETIRPLIFIASIGIAFYSVDAFFNFPSDRTEIQILMAVFVASATAAYGVQAWPENTNTARFKITPLALIFMILILPVVYVLYLNVQSLRAQRLMFPQITGGKLTLSSQDPSLQMPVLPDITSWGEAVDVTVARYLINDKRFDDAYHLLLNSRSNPFDPRREYFLSWMYDERQQKDSALYYMKRAAEMKPFHYKYTKNTSIYFENAGLAEESEKQFSGFVERSPKSAEARIDLIDFYRRHNRFEEAMALALISDSLIPNNTEIKGRKELLARKLYTEPYLPVFRQAYEAFKKGNYQQSKKLLDDFLARVNDYSEAYALSAYLNLELKNHERCLADIARMEEMGNINPALVNVQGIALLRLGRHEEACAKFDAAAKQGDPSGLSNYEKHCKADTAK